MQLLVSGYLTPSRIKDFCKDPAYFFDQYVGDLTFTTEQLAAFDDNPSAFFAEHLPSISKALSSHLTRALRADPAAFFAQYANQLQAALDPAVLAAAQLQPRDLTNIRTLISPLLALPLSECQADPSLLFTKYSHDLLREIGKRAKDPGKWPTKHIATLIGTGAHAAYQYAHQKRIANQPFTMEEVKAAALAAYFHDLAETYPLPGTPAALYLDNLLRIGYLRDVSPTIPLEGTPEFAAYQRMLADAHHTGLPIAAAWVFLEEANTNQTKDPLDPRIDTRKNTRTARKIYPQTLVFGNSPIQSLEEGEKVVLQAARSIVRRLLPDEVGDKAIVTVERKLNYIGLFPFSFYGRIDAQTADGTIKDLKTTASKTDKWAKFQLLCYGLPDFLSDPLNPTLDPIQVDQLAKDDESHITTFSYSPTRQDYATVYQMVLQAGEQVQLMNDLVTYDPKAFQQLLDDYAQEFVARKTIEPTQFMSDLPANDALRFQQLLEDHSLVLVAYEAVEPLHLVEDLPNDDAVAFQKLLDDYGVVLVARETVKPLLLVSAAPAAHDHEFPDLLIAPGPAMPSPPPNTEVASPSKSTYKFPDLMADAPGKALSTKYKLEFLLPPVKKGDASALPVEEQSADLTIEEVVDDFDLIL